MRLSRLALAVSLASTACSLDLSLPQEPALGALAGSVDTGGRIGVSNLDVVAIDDQGTRVTVKTADTGAFRFSDIKPRLYALELKVPGFAPLVVPNVRVKSGDTTDVGVLAPAWLGGTDAESRLVGKVAPATGSGEVLGASVEFALQPGADRVATEVVGLDGEFDVRLPPGTYTLRGEHPNYVTAERRDIVLPPGTTVDLRAMPLLLAINPATLTGTVLKEQEGQPAIPAEGALITLDSGETTTADVAGHFMVTGLAAGTRTVRVTLAGFTDPLPTRTVLLKPGMPTALDPITVELLRGTLTGTVEMIDRSPADNVLVAVGGSSYGAVVSPTAAEPFRGTWQIRDVPYGTYEVSASKAGYIKASVQVTLNSANAQVSDLKLSRPLGDFLIEDADTTNTFGYTRTTAVTLKITFPATVVEYRASERSDFSDAPTFLPFSNMNQPFTLSAAEGIKTVYVQGRDAAAMVGSTLSANVTLDTTPPPAPEVTLSSTGSVGSGSTLVKFTRSNAVLPLTVVGSDVTSGVAGVKLSASNVLDSAGRLPGTTSPYQQDLTFNRSVTTDGVQVVYVQVIDNAGNASPLGTDSVVVDTVAPTGSVTVARGPRATVDGFTNQQLVDVNVASAAEPNGGAVLLKLANSAGAELDAALFAPVRPTQPWFLASGPTGVRTVYAQLRDSAGNTSAQVSGTVTYDTTAPTLSGSIVGGALKNATNVTVQISTAATDLSPTQAVSLSEDVSFAAAGTVGPVPLPGSNQVAFTLTAGDGVRTIYIRLRDGAGNDGVAPVSVTLDTAPPTGTIRVTGTLDDGTASDTLTATTSVTVTPNISGAVEYVLGDASLSACPTSGYTAIPPSNSIAATLGGSGTTREV
ncbi:MAG: carboxypeptidase regulatory-like domain-containing protein, partial [Archangium sp.]|nr:carboxypeptidase regulatory-like domain-containing protein [Archangium sp.]